jgi:hypothetical protein
VRNIANNYLYDTNFGASNANMVCMERPKGYSSGSLTIYKNNVAIAASGFTCFTQADLDGSKCRLSASGQAIGSSSAYVPFYNVYNSGNTSTANLTLLFTSRLRQLMLSDISQVMLNSPNMAASDLGPIVLGGIVVAIALAVAASCYANKRQNQAPRESLQTVVTV